MNSKSSMLGGKRIIWSQFLRVFFDNGTPRFRWLPKFRSIRFNPRWGLRGVVIYWLGRELTIVVGVDNHGLYK